MIQKFQKFEIKVENLHYFERDYGKFKNHHIFIKFIVYFDKLKLDLKLFIIHFNEVRYPSTRLFV